MKVSTLAETLTLEIDPSLLEHLRERLAQRHRDTPPVAACRARY